MRVGVRLRGPVTEDLLAKTRLTRFVFMQGCVAVGSLQKVTLKLRCVNRQLRKVDATTGTVTISTGCSSSSTMRLRMRGTTERRS